MTEAIEVGWFGPAHGCWAWFQDHFHCVRILDAHDFENWLVKPDSRKGQTMPRVVFAVLEHRNDVRIAVVNCVANAKVERATARLSRFACLLGSDWQGHRRTHPLPDTLESFYWFQLFDRTLPWVIRKTGTELHGGERLRNRPRSKPETPSPVHPRVQRILDQASWSQEQLMELGSNNLLAWVVTDNLQQRKLWEEVFDRLHVRSVSSRIDAVDPWCQPELIVVDCIAREIDSRGAIRKRIAEIKRHHPDAFLVLVDPFPIWEGWLDWIECGVNALLPRPFQMDGVLIAWQRWLQHRS